MDYLPLRYLVYLGFISLLSCTSTPVPPSVFVKIPEDFFGMVHAGNTETPEEYTLLDEMGVKWILYTLVSEDKQPAYVVKTITGIAARGARALLWYELFDSYSKGDSQEPGNSEAYFGLVYPDYNRKKGSYAYSLCAAYLAGREYRPDLIEKNNIPKTFIVFYFADKTGSNTLVLWNDKNAVIPIHISLGNPGLLHDVSTGENTIIPGEAALDIGSMPVILTWDNAEEAYRGPQISYTRKD